MAAAIGYLQAVDLLPILNAFLKDADERVRTVAAMSLVSFDAKEADELLKLHHENPEFHAGFVNALALKNPAAWMDELALIVAGNFGDFKPLQDGAIHPRIGGQQFAAQTGPGAIA